MKVQAASFRVECRRRIVLWSLGYSFNIVASMVPYSVFASNEVAPAKLYPPEIELRKIYEEVERLAQAVNSLPGVADQAVIGPRKIAAERAWAASQEFVRSGNHVSSVRELGKYLSLVQTGDAERYLVAQKQLAFSYDALKQSERSLRAALRYVSAFVAQRHGASNHDDLVEILTLIARLTKKSGVVALNEVKQLFATLSAGQMPARPKAKILLLAARAAGSTGDLRMAKLFLMDPVFKNADSDVSGERTYLRGIMQVLSGNPDEGELSFKAAIAQFGSAASSLRDKARLALARVQMQKGHPDLAAASYLTIDEGSEQYGPALYESVFALIELGKIAEARDAAVIFKKQFGKDDTESRMNLAKIDAWLAMQVGDIAAAQNAIKIQRDSYVRLLDLTRTELGGDRPIDSVAIKKLFEEHHGLINPPREIEFAWKAIGKFDARSADLDEARGGVREVFFELGKAQLSDINPSWLNQAKALEFLVLKQLEMGHRLIATQRFLLGERLTPAEKQELSASEGRRAMLLGEYPKVLAASEGWRNTADLYDAVIRLDRANKRLQSAQSSLATIAFFRGAMPEGYRTLSEELQSKLSRALALTRAQQIRGLANGGQHRRLRRLMGFYTMAILDEEAVLTDASDLVTDTAQRLLVADMERAWRLWKIVSRSIYDQLETLDKKVMHGLQRVVGDFWQIDGRVNSLEGQIASMTDELNKWVSARRGRIISVVSSRVSERIARLDKWSADIDAGRSEEIGRARTDDLLDFNLRRQSARDEILDLQAGGAAVWLE